MCSAVSGVWGLVSFKGQGAMTATGKQALPPPPTLLSIHRCNPELICFLLLSQSQSCRLAACNTVFTGLKAGCLCRFNDFLTHTSGMGTVDNEKVFVGNLPSQSLYEYCFDADQQCWKVS